MSKDRLYDDDPNNHLLDSGSPKADGNEQNTRNTTETERKEQLVMVGEKYQDLILAADAIISMSKNAQAIQSNLEKLKVACDVEKIKQDAKSKIQKPSQENQADLKRKHVYMIATLIKSLADVPEQIWHALEHHRYLHASRLYVLAEKVHEYLEEEKTKSTIDIEVAFPVIQRQWDAVCAFKSQIIQRASHYLRVSEQPAEHMAEVIVGLMLLDQLSYKESVERLLEIRTTVIQDILEHYTKSVDSTEHRISHQIRELALMIKRTLVQIYKVFVVKESSTLIESYVESFQETFLIPLKSSHGNETPSQPAITRLFSPSSNVPLIVRFLPESLQTYKPEFNPLSLLDLETIQQMTKSWIQSIEALVKEKLSEILLTIANQHELVHIRSKLWDLLDEDENTKEKNNEWLLTIQTLLQERYSMWDHIYRDVFNQQAKHMVDRDFNEIIHQLEATVWPSLVDVNRQVAKKNFSVTMHIWPGSDLHKQQDIFALPNLSSSKEIEEFKSSLKETANDRTSILCSIQNKFDNTLENARKDILAHLGHHYHDLFHIKEDMENIKKYFEDKCYDTMTQYAKGLVSLMERLNDWKDQSQINEISISLGRFAKNISVLSKQLPKALSLSIETIYTFELRSSINQDPKYKQVQDVFLDTFHKAHDPWIQWLKKEFIQKLKSTLVSTKWNDQCFSISVWESVEEGMKLPTQATHQFVQSIFYICEELQKINSSILDKHIMNNLRKELFDGVQQIINKHIKELEITENGALQLIFDYLFLSTVLQQESKALNSSVIEYLQTKVDFINWETYEPYFKPNVNKFYIKQSLIFGVLTSASNETYERARKTITNQQQGQYNVLPLAPQTTRFTLLPIGHLTSSSVRTR